MKTLKIFFLFTFILVSSSMSIRAQFEIQESGVTVDLYDVCFIDSLNGWIIGDSTTILSTNNGGKNWVKQISPVDTFQFSKVQFVTRQNGFIIGNKGLLLSTKDGGLNWIKSETGFNYNFSDISFVDTLNGWLSCWLETQTERIGAIIHTDNGGNSWSEQIKKVSYQLFNSTIFMSVKFLNDRVGWALGGDYADNFSETFVYFTNDSGLNWNNIGIAYFPLRKIEPITKDTLWAIGIPFALSKDGGVNWETPTHDEQIIYPISIQPINSLEGWLIHFDILTKENKLFFTNDGGLTWIEKYVFTNKYATELSIYKDKLFIVGKLGLIMKKDLITDVNLALKENIESFMFLYNYPNPFNGSTNFSYKISSPTFLTLDIFNLLGEKIITLVKEYHTIGVYNVTFKANNLPSGIYFAKFQDKSDHNKIMKLIHLK